MTLGGVEAGGTKWVCAVGDGDAPLATETFPTTTPQETLGRAIRFFSDHGPVDALGIGTFGPVDVRESSPAWGHITTTPKPGWANTSVGPALREALGIAKVVVDTDVNAAALGEARAGAAIGLDTFCYVTIGTGIGGGFMVNGGLVHGLLHPELGHMRIPHDRARDPFDGACPFHGDCFEGLASGHAMATRWGKPAEQLGDDDAWALEAEYVALALANVTFMLSPQRIVVGGGVAKHPKLLPLVRTRLRDRLGGYLDAPELTDRIDEYVVAPALGDRSGIVGALELARRAA